MGLTEHDGIRSFEKRVGAAMFVGYNKKPEKGTAAERAAKLRSKFRKQIRGCADKLVELSGTDNGRGSFQALRMGFELAQSAPHGAEVLYASFDGATGTPFFFTRSALSRVDSVLEESEKLLEEIEKLLKVEEVMKS